MAPLWRIAEIYDTTATPEGAIIETEHDRVDRNLTVEVWTHMGGLIEPDKPTFFDIQR